MSAHSHLKCKDSLTRGQALARKCSLREAFRGSSARQAGFSPAVSEPVAPLGTHKGPLDTYPCTWYTIRLALSGSLEMETTGRYFGKVCDRHPDFKGERRSVSRECLGCQRDRRKRRAESPEGKAARRIQSLARVGANAHARAVKKDIEAKILNRQIEIQQQRNEFTTHHMVFRQEAIEQLRAEGMIPK
jgi:hypothetical protein